MSIFDKRYIEIKFRDKIFGSLPGNREIFEAWMRSKFEDPENTENTETDLDLDHEMEQSTTQFRKDEYGIYMHAYQLKAMLGQCGSLLEFTTKKRGTKNTLKEGTFIKGMDENGSFTGEKVYLLPRRTEHEGVESFTGNVSTAQGSRSIINNVQFCEQPTLRFQLWLLQNRIQEDNRGKKLSIDDFSQILELAQEVGLGGARKFEKGKFDVIANIPFHEFAQESWQLKD